MSTARMQGATKLSPVKWVQLVLKAMADHKESTDSGYPSAEASAETAGQHWLSGHTMAMDLRAAIDAVAVSPEFGSTLNVYRVVPSTEAIRTLMGELNKLDKLIRTLGDAWKRDGEDGDASRVSLKAGTEIGYRLATAYQEFFILASRAAAHATAGDGPPREEAAAAEPLVGDDALTLDQRLEKMERELDAEMRKLMDALGVPLPPDKSAAPSAAALRKMLEGVGRDGLARGIRLQTKELHIHLHL